METGPIVERVTVALRSADQQRLYWLQRHEMDVSGRPVSLAQVIRKALTTLERLIKESD